MYKDDSVASRICAEVTIRDILGMIGRTEGRHGRTKCPLHDGKDYNFSYNAEVYQCFVCGAKGNAIRLVMDYYGIDFKQALRKINDYFHLGLIKSRMSYNEKSAMRLAEKERKIGREKTEQYKRRKQIELSTILDVLIRLERIKNPLPEVKEQISYYEMLFEELNDRQVMWNG